VFDVQSSSITATVENSETIEERHVFRRVLHMATSENEKDAGENLLEALKASIQQKSKSNS
jgi:hypothetical protein